MKLIRILSIIYVAVLVQCLFAQTDTSAIRTMINAVSIDTLTTHIRTLESAGGYYNRISYTPGNDTIVRYIYNTFKRFPTLTSVSYDTFYITSAPLPYNLKPLVNVVATLQGKKEPAKYFLIGGHLDCSASRVDPSIWPSQWQSIHAPGADDNATGVAAVLEVARIFSDTSFHYSNDYTLVFIAFGNEEGVPGISNGLQGSAHFAAEAKAKRMNIVGLINLDMLGYNQFTQYADIVADPASVWIGERCVDAINRYFLGVTTNRTPFLNGGYSDHASFWAQGFPAILLIEHAWPWTTDSNYIANPTYHRSTDTLGSLNMNLVQTLTRTAIAAAASIGSANPSIVRETETVPASISVCRNYPNPFNGTTNYEVRVAGEALHGSGVYVSLKIYDMLGRNVATLIDATVEAGTYRVQWNAHGFPSGVYLYRVQIGSFTETMRTVLVQ